jgi:mutator protein MutT
MMEIFDVVNENDEIIGTATREDCHSNPKLIHRTIHFTLFDPSTQKILLTQRAFNLKFDPGKFCFAGEHILKGETYDQALVRGIQEEMGFTPASFVELAHHLFAYAQQSEFIRFFCAYWDQQPLIVDPREIIKTEWLTLSELKDQPFDYSEMARYWISNANWPAIFSH